MWLVWTKLIGAFLYLACGILLLVYLPKGVITLTAILIALFIIGGVFRIVTAGDMKDHKGWGWVLFSGTLTLTLGLLIWLGWPGDAAWVIGLIVGIDLIFAGWWMVMFAVGIKNRK